MEYPQEVEAAVALELGVAAAKKLLCLKLTLTGTEKSRGQVPPGGEFVPLTRAT